jgi:hypothetical protein
MGHGYVNFERAAIKDFYIVLKFGSPKTPRSIPGNVALKHYRAEFDRVYI